MNEFVTILIACVLLASPFIIQRIRLKAIKYMTKGGGAERDRVNKRYKVKGVVIGLGVVFTLIYVVLVVAMLDQAGAGILKFLAVIMYLFPLALLYGFTLLIYLLIIHVFLARK